MRCALVALSVCSVFSTLVAATPLKFLKTRATAIDAYDYAGCFTEATFGRSLTGKSFYSDLMTNEMCATACSDFAWFGTEYGREVCRSEQHERVSSNTCDSATVAMPSARGAMKSPISCAPSIVLASTLKNAEQDYT